MTQAAEMMAPMRPLTKMCDVVPVENVLDDPDGVLATLKARGPFSLIYGAAAYDKLGGADPWFRDYWADTKRGWVDELAHHLHNPKLIAATKQAFNAEIVRPDNMCWNLHAPMLPGRPHLDTAPYRGVDRNALPTWLVFVIHHSQLFLHWVVTGTTGVVVFYKGPHGEFEYWPDGPDQPSQRLGTPAWNVGLVTDNEFMFHRPQGVGPADLRFRTGEIGNDAKLHHLPEGGWKIEDGRPHRPIGEDEVRFSIVWKALVFKDKAAEAVYDNRTDELTLDIVWDVLNEDLKQRGFRQGLPADPMEDRAFRTLLLQQYPNPGQHYFQEAKWR